MTGDKTLFEKLREVPPDFYVKQIKGKVLVKYWEEVRLSTDKGNGKRGELELREVLYMSGMSVNTSSFQFCPIVLLTHVPKNQIGRNSKHSNY